MAIKFPVDCGPYPVYLVKNPEPKKLKRTPLLLTLAVLALLAGGYFLYEKVLKKEPLRPWDLVPSETVFVYEKDVCQSCIDEIQKSAIWQILSRASFYSKPVDSLKAKLNAVIANGKGLLVSAHITRKDDFDFIYYLSGAQNLLDPLSEFPDLKGYRYSERELNDVKIHELTFNKHTFSWVLIRDVWVGSFTPFLIEDVIRTYKGKPNFSETTPEVRKLPRISGDAGNVYLQLKHLADWFSIFISRYERSYALGKSSLLDIKSIDNNLVLNGFSLDSLAYPADYFLSIFRNQTPVSFSLKNYVPNRAILFTSYGVNDGATFSRMLERFVLANKPHMRDSLNILSSGLGFKWNDLLAGLSNEVGVCQLEGIESQRLVKILMIETKEPDEWRNHLNAVAEKFSEDTVFYERFLDYTIREIPVRRFPQKLLWPLVQGFDHTYYTSRGSIIFMGDNLEELKYFLEDIEHEDIWGKSVSKNQFLESTLLESNVSVFINTPKIWNVLLPKLNPRWRNFVRENQALLQAVQMSAFQFSHLNNTYYTNITINQGKAKPGVTFASVRRNVVHFAQPIHRLHAVKSHVSRADEILIQDSLNDISLVSMEGKVLWQLPAGDQITSDIQQIDFYKNGKLQYIFSTHDAIHIIDRLGNYVPPYPLHLKGKDIQQLSVLDYDRSKDYRFLLSEEDGKLWMFDKNGNSLEGWSPRAVGAALMAPPMHHRIRGRDFIIAIRKDGLVHLYNRRGEMMKNFPLDIQGIPMGDYFLDMGPDIASTHFVVITRDGFRVRFSPEGRIQSRETLLRASVGSQFGMKAEKSNKSYLVWQHNTRQLTVSDPTGKKILVNDYMHLKDWDIKYYHYGGGKSFITLTDKIQELSYVFDGNGNLLTSPPLQSTAIELRMANSDQSHVFFIHDKTLTIQPLDQ